MRKQAPNHIVALLMQPENVGPSCEIYNAFRDVLEWTAKIRLFKEVFDQCRKRLKDYSNWEVELDADDDRELLEQEWLSIYVKPRPRPHRDYWHFELDMNATNLPFKLLHGVAYSSGKGSRPQSMSQKLCAEVKRIEGQFRAHKLKGATGNWLSITYRPYERYTLGNDPRVMTRLCKGALANQITAEYVQFFKDWSGRVTDLNSLLKHQA